MQLTILGGEMEELFVTSKKIKLTKYKNRYNYEGTNFSAKEKE